MSQKINPISNKLGILQLWNTESQKYGRSFQNYKKITRLQNYIFNYTKRFLHKNSLILKSINISFSLNHTHIKIFVFNLKNIDFSNERTQLHNSILKWLTEPTKLLLYQNENPVDSAYLINNYIIHLFYQKLISPKKIIQIIYQVLKQQSRLIKVILTVNGLKSIRLKGFKLKFSGCFEASRNQMSKTIKCNFGSVPLTKLNGYVDYSTNNLHTKFGSCGFKLWLFYEIIW